MSDVSLPAVAEPNLSEQLDVTQLDLGKGPGRKNVRARGKCDMGRVWGPTFYHATRLTVQLFTVPSVSLKRAPLHYINDTSMNFAMMDSGSRQVFLAKKLASLRVSG